MIIATCPNLILSYFMMMKKLSNSIFNRLETRGRGIEVWMMFGMEDEIKQIYSNDQNIIVIYFDSVKHIFL